MAAQSRYRRLYRPEHPRSDSSGMIDEHVLISESALGHYLPAGAEVHHVDENRTNNATRNLVICQSHQYHKMLHARALVVRAGGNPDTHKLCSTCRGLKPFIEFALMQANKSTGRQANCRICDADRLSKRKAAA